MVKKKSLAKLRAESPFSIAGQLPSGQPIFTDGSTQCAWCQGLKLQQHVSPQGVCETCLKAEADRLAPPPKIGIPLIPQPSKASDYDKLATRLERLESSVSDLREMIFLRNDAIRDDPEW